MQRTVVPRHLQKLSRSPTSLVFEEWDVSPRQKRYALRHELLQQLGDEVVSSLTYGVVALDVLLLQTKVFTEDESSMQFEWQMCVEQLECLELQ